MSVAVHDGLCDTGQPCEMCVESDHATCTVKNPCVRCVEANEHDFQQVEGQSVLECACGAVPDYEDEPEWWKQEMARTQATLSSDAARPRYGHVLLTPETCNHARDDERFDKQCPVCDGGLAVCANCGTYEAGLDGPCVPRQKQTTPRTFSDVLNEWTGTVLMATKTAEGLEAITLVTQIGLLGQRLIYEANALGQNDGLRYAVERVKERA